MAKRLRNAFGYDMDSCILTGYGGRDVERHHIFGGPVRYKSEFYGYVVPLAPWVHPNGSRFDEKLCKETTGLTRREVDLKLKCMAQTDYELNHGTREQFIREFGRSYK